MGISDSKHGSGGSAQSHPAPTHGPLVRVQLAPPGSHVHEQVPLHEAGGVVVVVVVPGAGVVVVPPATHAVRTVAPATPYTAGYSHPHWHGGAATPSHPKSPITHG